MEKDLKLDGFVEMDSKSTEYAKKKSKINKMLRESIKDVQEIIITEGETIEFKIKGRLIQQTSLPILDGDDLNFFVGVMCEVTTPSRPAMKLPTANNSRFLYDTKLLDSLLNDNDKSYIVRLSFNSKTVLRCVFYQATSSSGKKSINCVSIRVQPNKIPDIDTLNLSNTEHLKKAINKKQGLIIISGFTGTGKTWTLSSLIKYLNTRTTERKFILTLEPSIEFMFRSSACKIIQRTIGTDTPTYSTGSEDSLVQNEDILVFSEVKNMEGFYRALQTAESGKLVLMTSHARSLEDIFDRFVYEFPLSEHESLKNRLIDNIVLLMHQDLINYKTEQLPIINSLYIDNNKVRSEVKEIISRGVGVTDITREGFKELLYRDKDYVINNRDNYEYLDKKKLLSAYSSEKNKEIFRVYDK